MDKGPGTAAAAGLLLTSPVLALAGYHAWNMAVLLAPMTILAAAYVTAWWCLPRRNPRAMQVLLVVAGLLSLSPVVLVRFVGGVAVVAVLGPVMVAVAARKQLAASRTAPLPSLPDDAW